MIFVAPNSSAKELASWFFYESSPLNLRGLDPKVLLDPSWTIDFRCSIPQWWSLRAILVAGSLTDDAWFWNWVHEHVLVHLYLFGVNCNLFSPFQSPGRCFVSVESLHKYVFQTIWVIGGWLLRVCQKCALAHDNRIPKTSFEKPYWQSEKLRTPVGSFGAKSIDTEEINTGPTAAWRKEDSWRFNGPSRLNKLLFIDELEEFLVFSFMY